MNRAILENAGVNYNDGLRRFSNNVALYEKFLNKFLQDETMSACRIAVSTKNYSDACVATHTLKGVAGNLSFERLYLACDLLLKCLRSENFEQVDELFCGVDTAYKEVILGISIG